ncbi:hypothetical protein Leryth_012715 [Lithospermum erythrorhizon]|nr:hypothetical protein Leryth_012715 [Lithospermum erythrorhizon]
MIPQTTGCSVNFENQNYTIITSQCKGPNYNKTTCCDAFKQFACPHADQISDMKTNCADTLFSYINLYGKYPPGLFANLCSDKDGGVNCDGVDFKKADPSQSSSAFLKTNMISVMMAVIGSSMMVLWSFMV